jgi:recombination protein RecA
VNAAAELLDLGSAANIIEKSGTFYSYKGERIGQGRDKAAAYLTEHAAIAAEIRTRLIDIRRAELAGAPPLTTVDAAAA